MESIIPLQSVKCKSVYKQGFINLYFPLMPVLVCTYDAHFFKVGNKSRY